jgi:hypothetical protein
MGARDDELKMNCQIVTRHHRTDVFRDELHLLAHHINCTKYKDEV